jgi:hypothetical protein
MNALHSVCSVGFYNAIESLILKGFMAYRGEYGQGIVKFLVGISHSKEVIKRH